MRPPGRPWLIAAAVEQEIEGIRAALQGQGSLSPRGKNAWAGEWKGGPLLLVRTGIGPERAKAALAPLVAQEAFQGIVSTGYAGGLRDEYRLGDLLLPDEVRSVPPLREASFHPDRELRERVLKRAQAGPWRIHPDRMITTDRVIFSAEEKRRLGLQFDAGSVEMESAAVAGVAGEASIPFVVVRVVLDEASFSLPDLLKVFRWMRKRKHGRLISYLAFHPRGLLELLSLRRRSRRASRVLNRLFLDHLLDGLIGSGES